MSVWTKTQVDEIQNSRRASDIAQLRGILPGGAFEIGRFHRHGMDLLGTNWRVIKQTFSKMHQISIWVCCWGDAFVHLHYMDAFPLDFFIAQRT